jgi:hypothetical protein
MTISYSRLLATGIIAKEGEKEEQDPLSFYLLPLLILSPCSCAKAIVKTPRAASLAKLPERMWREGAYAKLSVLRKMKKEKGPSSSSSSPQRLQAFLKAVRDDYRTLSRELRLRLPSSALQRDAPRVDVGRMQASDDGDGRRRERERDREQASKEGRRGGRER